MGLSRIGILHVLHGMIRLYRCPPKCNRYGTDWRQTAFFSMKVLCLFFDVMTFNFCSETFEFGALVRGAGGPYFAYPIALQNPDQSGYMVGVVMRENYQVDPPLPRRQDASKLLQHAVIGAAVIQQQASARFVNQDAFALANVQHPNFQTVPLKMRR